MGTNMKAIQFINKPESVGENIKTVDLFHDLRQKLHPITLWGEEHVHRYKRLKSNNSIRGPTKSSQTRSQNCPKSNQLNSRIGLLNDSISTKDLVLAKNELQYDVFMRASLIMKDELEDALLSAEDFCAKWIQRWTEDWKRYLDTRPLESCQNFHFGKNIHSEYLHTKKALGFLLERLNTKTLKEDVKKGLWYMIKAMKKRCYSFAYTILLNEISIGSDPWPIGVTQVGIHTKSAAREKISNVHQNKNAAAHIMGDEATRKYLHGLKRLLSVIQRLYPEKSIKTVPLT